MGRLIRRLPLRSEAITRRPGCYVRACTRRCMAGTRLQPALRLAAGVAALRAGGLLLGTVPVLLTELPGRCSAATARSTTATRSTRRSGRGA